MKIPRLSEETTLIAMAVISLAVLVAIARALQPALSPFCTIMFVLIFTVNSFRRLKTAAGAICGLAIYSISWTQCVHGTFYARVLCFIGLGLWFLAAVIIPLFRRSVPIPTMAASK